MLFECPSSYAPIKPIGKGAYGIVCSACDVRTQERVAIKKIGAIFSNPLDAKRTLREVQILRHLTGHQNVVALKDLFPPPSGPTEYNDVYMVQEVSWLGVREVQGREPARSGTAPAGVPRVLLPGAGLGAGRHLPLEGVGACPPGT